MLGDEGGAPALVREAVRAAPAAYDAGHSDDGLLAALLAHFGDPDPQTLARTVNDEPTPGNWSPAAPAVCRAAVGSTVVAAGSVVVHQPRLAESFRARLAAAHPSLTLHLLDVPPVAGAVALARARYRAL